MKKYAKIINEETKQCEVGLGTNVTFYKSIGMVEMDVEEAWNGAWYVAGYCPEKPAPTKEEIAKLREQAYIKEVDILHAQKMRKTILNTWTEEDETNYVAEVKRLSEDIANRYPYPEEIVTEIVEEQLELPLEV